MIVDPPPAKSGIVRDRALRLRLRACIEEAGLNPDKFTATDIKKLDAGGKLVQASGVPIRSMVLLRTMSDPVIIERKQPDYASAKMLPNDNPASLRAYVGGNNRKILCPPNPYWMEHEEVTIAELLKPAGYTSMHIGKWHLGDPAWYPEHQDRKSVV